MTGVFWVTSACNLNCIYCYEGNNKEKKFMSAEVIDKSVDFLIDKMRIQNDKRLLVAIHGGEPFLAFDSMKNLVKTVKEKAKENNIQVSFMSTTNSTVLTEEMMEFIANEIKNITISLDGKKETQDYSRPFKNGRGTHDIVERNVKELLKHIPNLRVRLTYNNETVNKLYENLKYLIDLGVKFIVPARDFGDKKFSADKFDILKRELIKTKKYLLDYPDTHIGMLEENIKHLGNCGGGIVSFNFQTDGEIYPCTLTVGHKEFIIGNVFEGIDTNKRDKLLSYSKKINEDCDGCDLYYFCKQTRCKMINKIIMGEYCKPSPIDCMEANILYDINFGEDKEAVR